MGKIEDSHRILNLTNKADIFRSIYTYNQQLKKLQSSRWLAGVFPGGRENRGLHCSPVSISSIFLKNPDELCRTCPINPPFLCNLHPNQERRLNAEGCSLIAKGKR
jgi:hypothetical protein